MSNLMEISDLNVNYGESKILRNANMTFNPGSITAVMGRNGVGKTTLLKSIIGLLKPESGTITMENADVTSWTPDKRAKAGIAYVPQGREIFPKLTVAENLQMGLEARRDGLKKVPEDEIIELFPILGTMRHRMGGNLSGGQQQQLSIARALVSEPKLLLLDEPTEGIQPSIIQDIGEVLLKLKARGNMGIVLVEQYLDFAQRLADDFFILDRGAVVVSGKRSDLTDDHVRKYLTF